MTHHTDVVLRNIVRYLEGEATRIERDRSAGRIDDGDPEYWHGSVDGLRAAANQIRRNWITPTGRFHDTPVLRLVRSETTKETEA